MSDAEVAEGGTLATPNGAPALVPRDAATLILIDRTGPQVRLLMGKRHPDLVFMPGTFVFPGGALEPGDGAMNVVGALPEIVERRLLTQTRRRGAAYARALALAAVRETFEETGLVVGTREYGPPDGEVPPGAWSAFAALGAYPVLEDVHFVARAITPPGRKRRFDTRFFAMEASAIVGSAPGVVGPNSELTELAWLTVDEMADANLPDITRTIVAGLATRLEANLDPLMPVPFLRTRYGRVVRTVL